MLQDKETRTGVLWYRRLPLRGHGRESLEAKGYGVYR